MSSEIASQIFKILFKNGDIKNSFLSGVFFIRYVQLKSSSSDEENYTDNAIEEESVWYF